MKTSAVLASLLFGTFAVAAPFDRRALVTKTEIVTETVVVYTTVYGDASGPTTPEGLFYEQPAPSTTAVEQPTPDAAPAYSPAYAPPAKVEESSSAYVAPPQAPSPTPTPPAPQPTPEQPKAVPSEPAYVAPSPAPAPAAPAAPSPAPVAPAPQVDSTPASGNTATTGEKYTDVDITIYDNDKGGYGACGTVLHDSDMIVALAKPAWGESTYDVMTGASTNPWCGQKIQIEHNGNTIEATIMDMCPGCAGHDIDLSYSAWKALTGTEVKERRKASWSKIG